jgi:hypothetical protein
MKQNLPDQSYGPASFSVSSMSEQSRNRIMKETFWSKLRELWAIRRYCQPIKLQQRQNPLPRSNEFYDGTQQLAKILPKRRTLRSTGQSA